MQVRDLRFVGDGEEEGEGDVDVEWWVMGGVWRVEVAGGGLMQELCLVVPALLR